LWFVSSLSAGGAERVIAELANAFADRGHTVAVLTLAASETDHYQLDTRVERIALNVIRDSFSLWQSVKSNVRRIVMIRKAIMGFAPDVVVSFIEQNNVRVLSAMLGSSIPIIVSERIDPRWYPVGRVWDSARRLLYPFAQKVVVQTERVAQWARKVTRPKRVVVIPNFVRDLPPLNLASAEIANNTLLTVGRLDHQKGFDVLLRAFFVSGLPALGVNLVVLGQGPERQALQSLAVQLGIEEFVDMPGVVDNPEDWMVKATVYVQPSRYEGFPNALLEAMAMGCPVVATDCESGPREIIQHGENGLLVPVEDPEALAASLQMVFEDAALRTHLRTQAVRVREHFSKVAIVNLWERLIEDVLK
jgi:glycosyltransferase involved in cell wall biosynthesis